MREKSSLLEAIKRALTTFQLNVNKFIWDGQKYKEKTVRVIHLIEIINSDRKSRIETTVCLINNCMPAPAQSLQHSKHSNIC